MMRKAAIFYFSMISLFCCAQDEMITKLNRRDSIRSNKIASLYRKNTITNEIHNVLFRNIYPSQSYNEEEVFKQEIDRLAPFNNKYVDTIIIVQLNALGENVYDTSMQSNKFEDFLSNSLHVNTRQKVIRNRYLFMSECTIFSSYTAYENARLIRSSGIFHDVRIEAHISGTDSQSIILVYRIQDLFPYGFSLGLNGSKDVSFGIENANIAGWNHRVNTDFRINTYDNHQLFGYGIRFTIPNLINKSFIDGFAQYRNVRLENSLELGVFREFVRPEFRWAGGNIFSYRDIGVLDGFNILPNRFIENNVWISHALPFKSKNTTINAIIGGIGLNTVQHFERPQTNLNERFKYSNTNLFLVNLGYSRVKFMQDRLLNGFGRAEDIPLGISINTIFGIDMNEHGTRKYYGGQVLGQYHTGKGYYVNMNVRLGFFASETEASQGVWDFNFQQVSRAYKLGGFRLRNYFRMRTTIGVNQDVDIQLNDYDGIRGIRNFDFFGRSRFTTGFQSNLFIPITFMGFRFSVFALAELAKIQPSFDDFFQTAIQSGLTAGIAIKNENLIFDVIQIQYGLYPSTSSLSQRGLVLTSILPFNFQRLDISRPRIVRYE
jgi:hypothetical protein